MDQKSLKFISAYHKEPASVCVFLEEEEDLRFIFAAAKVSSYNGI